MYAVKGVMEKGKVWLERHKWFYGWEVNKNQERGKGWDECTRDGVIWRKGGGGMGGGLLEVSVVPFLISPLVGNEKVPKVDPCGWGGQSVLSQPPTHFLEME